MNTDKLRKLVERLCDAVGKLELTQVKSAFHFTGDWDAWYRAKDTARALTALLNEAGEAGPQDALEAELRQVITLVRKAYAANEQAAVGDFHTPEFYDTLEKYLDAHAAPAPAARGVSKFKCWYPDCNKGYYFMNSCFEHIELEGQIFGPNGKPSAPLDAEKVAGERRRIAELIREHADNPNWISSAATANTLAYAVETDQWPKVKYDSAKADYDPR